MEAVTKPAVKVMKAVQKKKPAVNKKPICRARKKPGASSAQKEPAAAKKKPATGQMAGCYVTIAEAHHDGNNRTKDNPAMFMEVGATAA